MKSDSPELGSIQRTIDLPKEIETTLLCMAQIREIELEALILNILRAATRAEGMHLDFTTMEDVREVADVMGSFSRPWFVSGGWTIDLFLGRTTREHEDLETG